MAPIMENERKQNLASGSGKDIPVDKPNDSKADEQRNVVSKKTKRGVLRKRTSSEFKNVVMEEFSEEDERVVSRKRSARGSRKAIIEESTDSDEQVEIENAIVATEKRSSLDSGIANIETLSGSDEEREVEQCSTGLESQWVDFRKLADDEDTDRDYGRMLRLICDQHTGGTINRSSPDSRIPIIEIPSSSDEERYESDADTDGYDFFDDDFHAGESSRVAPARSEVEFRRRVLEIISKPYDMMEYMIIKKEFDSKCYTDYHPEFGNELMKWRNNWRKRLALMRGFYYWLHNLNREGAFKPWRDAVCLAVEPQPLSRGQ